MTGVANNKIRILSLFAGCGGLDLGFLLLGQVGPTVDCPTNPDRAVQAAWAAESIIYRSRPDMVQSSPYFDIVAAVEHDRYAAQSYDANIGPHIVRREVTDKRGRSKMAAASILALDPRAYADTVDVIIGGPPCQAYSLAGSRGGIEDERGKMVFVFADWVEALRPPLFLMENVEGLLSSYTQTTDLFGQPVRTVRLIDQLLSRYTAMGYDVQYKVLDAADYGAPQYRRRLFIVGTLPPYHFRFPAPTHAPVGDTAVTYGQLLPHVPCGRYIVEDMPERNAPAAAPTPQHLRWLAGKHPASHPHNPAFTVLAKVPVSGTANWIRIGSFQPDTTQVDGAATAGTIAWLVKGNFPPSSPHQPAPTIVAEPTDMTLYTVGNRFNGVGNTNALDEPAPAVVSHPINMTLYRLANRFAGYGGERGLGGFDQPAPTACAQDDLTIYITQQGNLLDGHGEGSSQYHPSPAVGAENPLRLTIRNRIAERGDGSCISEPAPAVTAHHTNMSVGLQAVRALPEGTQAGARRQAVRPLTVAECSRLQTFPAWMHFATPLKQGRPTKTAQYRQIGNAVPVVLAMTLAEAVVQALGYLLDNRQIVCYNADEVTR